MLKNSARIFGALGDILSGVPDGARSQPIGLRRIHWKSSKASSLFGNR